MIVYRTSVSSPQAPGDVFEYLARFSNAAQWDPGVLAGQDGAPGPPGAGSTYRLTVKLLGLRVPLEYRIVEFDAPRRVVLQAENQVVRSRDVIEVTPTPGGGSTVLYEATLTMKAVAMLTPLVAIAFRRIGDRAAQGLRTMLAA